jgi:hypothetical protein
MRLALHATDHSQSLAEVRLRLPSRMRERQSEPFLDYQRQMELGHSSSNCHTLFGISKIPDGNHIRTLLDQVGPDALQPCFDQALGQLRERNGLTAFRRLGGRCLIALDGTEYFCSQKLGCAQCSARQRANGIAEYSHAMLCATLVAPGHNRTVPLMPEFLAPQDGAEKQDCERNAAKRWLHAHAERVRPLRPVYRGDDLFCSQPLAEAVLAASADFLFVCKRDSHKTLCEYLKGADLERLVRLERKPGSHSVTYTYRWMEGVPLRDGENALQVNWIGVTIANAAGRTTCDGAFATSLPITPETAAGTAACARARWKIENESFNVLKNNGCHLEHNFGHGKQHLAKTFAAMNLLAFAFHTVCDCLETQWNQAREIIAKRTRFFLHLATLCAYVLLESWTSLIQTLIQGKAPPT